MSGDDVVARRVSHLMIGIAASERSTQSVAGFGDWGWPGDALEGVFSDVPLAWLASKEFLFRALRNDCNERAQVVRSSEQSCDGFGSTVVIA